MEYYELNTTDTYKRYNGSERAHLTLSNDSLLNDLEFSLDGSKSVGKLLPEETIDFNDSNIDSLHLKSRLAGAACPFRLWFYGSRNLLYDKEKLKEVNRSVPVHKTFKVVNRDSIYKLPKI